MSVWISGATGAPPFLDNFTAAPFENYDSYDDVANLSALTVGEQSPSLISSEDLGPVCFVKDTRILMVDGSWHAVQNITPGMLVADSNDPQNKYLTVKDTYVVETRSLVSLDPTCNNRYPNMRTLTVTPRHLVFDDSYKSWVEARKVRGAQLVTCQQPVRVYHIETTVWGGCIAEGVPCETLALSSAAKHARMAANSTAEMDVAEVKS